MRPMASLADLLDLSPSDKDVAERLHASEEEVRHWRLARAVPEDRVKGLIEWALLRGHLDEVAQVATATAPHYSEAAALLRDLGTSREEIQRDAELPITRILEEMREHRVFAGDPVARVRAIRADWDRRDELHDRIRAGKDD